MKYIHKHLVIEVFELLTNILSVSQLMGVTDSIFHVEIRQEAKLSQSCHIHHRLHSEGIKFISHNAIIYNTIITYTVHYLLVEHFKTVLWSVQQKNKTFRILNSWIFKKKKTYFGLKCADAMWYDEIKSPSLIFSSWSHYNHFTACPAPFDILLQWILSTSSSLPGLLLEPWRQITRSLWIRVGMHNQNNMS